MRIQKGNELIVISELHPNDYYLIVEMIDFIHKLCQIMVWTPSSIIKKELTSKRYRKKSF